MVKHTQTIRRLLPTNCLRVFNHFVGLACKGLKGKDIIMNSILVETLLVQGVDEQEKNTEIIVLNVVKVYLKYLKLKYI